MSQSRIGTVMLRKCQELSWFLRPGLLFFALSFVSIGLSILSLVIDAPSPQTVLQLAKQHYESYGPLVVLVIAFIEAIFLVGQYFPGTFMLLAIVLLGSDSIVDIISFWLLALLGFTLSSVVNYILGRKGLHFSLRYGGQESAIIWMRKIMRSRPRWSLFVSAAHPNLLAIYTVCAGVARLNPVVVIASGAVSMAVWLGVWLIIFVIGLQGLKTSASLTTIPPFLLPAVFFSLGVLICVVTALRKSRNSTRHVDEEVI